MAFQGVSQSTQPHCTGCRGHFRDASKCFNLDQTITLPPCHRLGSVPLTSLFSAFPQAKAKSQTCITKPLLDKSSWWSQSVAKHPHLLLFTIALTCRRNYWYLTFYLYLTSFIIKTQSSWPHSLIIHITPVLYSWAHNWTFIVFKVFLWVWLTSDHWN